MPDFLADVLSRRHNTGYKLSVETARSWNVPPSQIVKGEPTEWSRHDSLLSMALVMLEKETCQSCGVVSWHGHSTNREIMLELDTTTCFGCMELEKRQDDKSQKLGKGEKPFVLARMWDNSELPSRRSELERVNAKGK